MRYKYLLELNIVHKALSLPNGNKEFNINISIKIID